MKSLFIAFVFFMFSHGYAEETYLQTELMSESRIPGTHFFIQHYSESSSLALLAPFVVTSNFEFLYGQNTGNGTITRDRHNIEPLYEYLLRHLIVKFSKDSGSSFEPDLVDQNSISNQNLEKVMAALNELQQQELDQEKSVFSVFIRYTDETRTEIQRVFVERGPVFFNGTIPRYDNPHEMVVNLSEQMTRALTLPSYPTRSTSHEEAQLNPNNVERTNILGESSRITGIDEEFEQFLSHFFQEEINSIGLELQYGFFYGSRVIPRGLAVDRFGPHIESLGLSLPTNTGIIQHTDVREGGLTKLSDIEIYLVAYDHSGRFSVEQEEEILLRLRQKLNETTRRFHFGLKIAVSDIRFSNSLEAFFYLAERQIGRSWLPLPNAYSPFYPNSPVESCELALQNRGPQILEFFQSLVRQQ